MTSNKQLQDLLEKVASGDVDPTDAREQLVEAFRARPFEDLGFARVDHHRSIRQGFPEVILGLGKTPAQIADIAAEIVQRGSTLLVTRATEAAFAAFGEVLGPVLQEVGLSPVPQVYRTYETIDASGDRRNQFMN